MPFYPILLQTTTHNIYGLKRYKTEKVVLGVRVVKIGGQNTLTSFLSAQRKLSLGVIMNTI